MFNYAQRQLARILLSDLSMLEIAAEMFRRPDWVESTAKEIFNRLGTFSRSAYIAKVRQSQHWSKISDEQVLWPIAVKLVAPPAKPKPPAPVTELDLIRQSFGHPDSFAEYQRLLALNTKKPVASVPTSAQAMRKQK